MEILRFAQDDRVAFRMTKGAHACTLLRLYLYALTLVRFLA